MYNTIDNIEWVFKQDAEELLVSLKEILMKLGYKTIRQENDLFLFAKGSIPVMVVAHVDIVHNQQPSIIFHDQRYNVLWSPTGLGADDRAGVLGILNILEKGYRPYVLFTNYEESGGAGAYSAADELKKIVKKNNIRYIIELDRKGAEDCVFYACSNKEFEEYINTFGFKTAAGVFSDISILCPAWEIAGVNLSTGYYNHHTTGELLYLNELEHTVDRVCSMLDNVPDKSFKYETVVRYIDINYNKYGSAYYNSNASGKYSYSNNNYGYTFGRYDSWLDYDLYAIYIDAEDMYYSAEIGTIPMWEQWLDENFDILEPVIKEIVIQSLVNYGKNDIVQYTLQQEEEINKKQIRKRKQNKRL